MGAGQNHSSFAVASPDHCAQTGHFFANIILVWHAVECQTAVHIPIRSQDCDIRTPASENLSKIVKRADGPGRVFHGGEDEGILLCHLYFGIAAGRDPEGMSLSGFHQVRVQQSQSASEHVPSAGAQVSHALVAYQFLQVFLSVRRDMPACSRRNPSEPENLEILKRRSLRTVFFSSKRRPGKMPECAFGKTSLQKEPNMANSVERYTILSSPKYETYKITCRYYGRYG